MESTGMGSVVEEGEVLANMTLSMFTLADLMNHPWSYGGTKFWMVLMFAPLAFMFVTAYIVHIIHVIKEVHTPKLRREMEGDDDIEDAQYSKAHAMLSIRGLERQNTTFLHVRPEDELALGHSSLHK